MPHFLPIQCYKCSVLQIKPAQKLGPKWCCSMCRKPEIKVSAAPESNVSDVSLFVKELNLQQEAEEMEAVANTFGGVESLDGVFDWDGLYFQAAKTQKKNKWKRFTATETYEEDFANGAEIGQNNLKDRIGDDVALKQGGSQQGQFLSSLWGRWHQKAVDTDVVELMEFAGGEGYEEYGPCS